MNTGAIIMMLIGCGGLWGGLLVCVYITTHTKKEK